MRICFGSWLSASVASKIDADCFVFCAFSGPVVFHVVAVGFGAGLAAAFADFVGFVEAVNHASSP